MISFPLKAQRWPQLVFLSVCVTATESQETATCLISKKAKDVSEQRRWHFTERNTCTFSSTGSNSYITFPPHQSHCSCARSASAWLTWVCELFIPFYAYLSEPYLFLLLLFYTFCIYIEYMLSSPPNSALFKSCGAQVEENICSSVDVFCSCPNINKFSKVDAQLL